MRILIAVALAAIAMAGCSSSSSSSSSQSQPRAVCLQYGPGGCVIESVYYPADGSCRLEAGAGGTQADVTAAMNSVLDQNLFQSGCSQAAQGG